MSLAIRPEGPSSCPERAKPIFMGDRILDDDGFHALRVCQSKAESHGTTIVLQIEGVPAHPFHLHEVIHDRGDVIEGIGEGAGVWGITVAEARIIGSHKMISV